MASKTKAQEAINFKAGTRHEFSPSLATLTRRPINDMAVEAMPGKLSKREFIKNLLVLAGPHGITWAGIQESLIAAYGSAPKKRSSLYAILAGVPYEKKTLEKGIKVYSLK